jgi:hypothetical protein
MYLCTYYVGGTLAAWLCFGLLNFNSQWAWRAPCLLQTLGALIVGVYIACGLLVESPRWLVSVGRGEKALSDLATMHSNGDINDELVRMEYKEIEDGLIRDKMNGTNISYLSFFKTPGNRKRLIVVIALGTGTQLMGNGLVSYYLA